MSEVQRWELTPGDEMFPEELKDESLHIEALYGIGDPEVLQTSMLSVIGARRASPYGIAIAEIAGRVAGESGICVVSGGAMGCDYAASRAALDAGGKTVIVAGTGADRIYPASSEDVFRDAVSGGGAVIALERWGTHPAKHTFPKRNAVIAALSPVLLVAEAGARSGTMSTADTAIELGKTIYAAPGSIFSPTSQGTNRLIRDGAVPICSEVDLETRLSLDYGVLRVVSEGVTPNQAGLISALVAMPLRPDELATRLDLPVLSLLGELIEYESKGIVQRLPDGRFSLTSEAYEHYRTKTLANLEAGTDASTDGEG